MPGFAIVVVVLIAGAGLYLIITYNGLVRIRNTADESWSDVQTELQRRYNLIPNLVNTVKGYAAHERALLEEVTRLREMAVQDEGSPEHQARTESQLQGALRSLMVRLENYPDLKADQNFLELQNELTNTENRIQAAYRFYNGNVRMNNDKVQMFPSNMVAGAFGFGRREYFEIEDDRARDVPQVQL